MKRIFILCIAISVLFLATSCGGYEVAQKAEPQLEEKTQKVADVEIGQAAQSRGADTADHENDPKAIVGEANSGITIKYETITENFESPEDPVQKILVFSYDVPTVEIPSFPETADQINDALCLQGEQFYTGSELYPGVNQLLEAALDNYSYVSETGAEIGIEFSDVLSANTERLDDAVISFQFHEVCYTGSDNIRVSNSGLTFDAVDGKQLKLEDLSNEPELFCAFLATCMADDISSLELLREYFAQANEKHLWYLDSEGLTLVQEDGCSFMERIPYDQLKGHIKEYYLPAEIQESAEVSVQLLDENGDNAVISDMLTIDSNGLKVLISFHGTAVKIGLYSVEYDSYSDSFFNTDCYWECSRMANCAVQVETQIPETLPNLMIEYTDVNGTHNFFLGESGQDGSLLLIPDSIEILG